jgi:hypothetical protein
MPVAKRSNLWICGCSLAGIAGSNAAGDMDACVLWVLCVVRSRSLRPADHSSRGVLATVVCLSVIEKPDMRMPWPTRGCCVGRKKIKTKYMDESSCCKANTFTYRQESPCILWNPNVQYRVHMSQPASCPYSEPDQSNPIPLHAFMVCIWKALLSRCVHKAAERDY